MALYSIYEPAPATEDLSQRVDGIVFVKDGFNWPALFFPALWFLYHRLWIELLVFLAALIGMDALLSLSSFGEAMSLWCSIGLSLLVGLQANDLRERALARKGFARIGMIEARNRDEAEFRFFENWLPAQERSGDAASRRVQDAAAKLAGTAPPPGGGDVIGSFPRA
jgi:hypothetical protein